MPFFNAKSGKEESLRAFLDRGSQISVVSSECAARLDLEVKAIKKVKLSTFSNKAKKCELKVCEMDFYENPDSFSGKLTINPYIMDDLVEPITSYEMSDRQRNFLGSSQYVLSDYQAGQAGSLKVDMLLGQDCVHQFNKGASIFLPGGSVLVPTWGGKYILAGPVDGDDLFHKPQSFESPRYLIVHSVNCSVESLKNLGFSKKIGKLVKNVYSCVTNPDELEVIDTFRNFEILGISPLDFKLSPILERHHATTTFDGERYWVELPYKDPQIKSLSNNFFQAFSRLLSGHRRRLKLKYEVEAEKYKKSFEDEIARGVLEKVETLGSVAEVSQKLARNPQFFNQIQLPDGRQACYLPHQAVYNKNGKFRRVMDGKARPYKTAYSLNDCLETGPNLVTSILHILLGFRKEKWAAQADIEKAFPQVGIKEEYRDVLRCLWIEDGQVVVYRFARLPFGLACSPFILQATLRLHLGENNIDEKTMSNFIASIYVDDSVWSEAGLEQLMTRKDFYTKLFEECGMLFRDWTSNHKEAREKWAKLEGREPKAEQTTLGMFWDTEKDILKINSTKLQEVIKRKVRTKRDIWKVVPSIYDPLGLLAPYVLLGKMIVNAACREVKGWDSLLPPKFVDSMVKWSEEFSNIENISWSRWAGIENPKRIQLYGCCDASSYAMGACVYLISTAQDDTITANLIMGKTRNSPPEQHSIPRLELASAVLLTNLMAHVRKIYKIEDKDVTWFTDSADVLFWIYSGHLSWKPYVANQIQKIKKCGQVQSWRHIDTKQNPADLASRGETIKNLAASDFWHCGPKYWRTGNLDNGASKVTGFDKHYKNLEISKNCFGEMQPKTKRQLAAMSEKTVTVSALSSVEVEDMIENSGGFEEKEVKIKLELPRIDRVIDMSSVKKSDYDSVMELSECVRKCVEKWKIYRKTRRGAVPKKGAAVKNMMGSSFVSAEVMWIQSIQKRYFSEIFLLLEKPKAKVTPFSRKLVASHAVFLDRDLNILRCTTRNEKATVDYASVYPILLPSSVRDSEGKWEDCPFTKKLVQQRHDRIGHHGVPDTLAHLRSEFWILRGRRFVQKVLKGCVTCRIVQGTAYSVPPAPPLPEFRVARSKPFSGVGVDYLGPFKCKDSLRGKVYKAWYISFVCGNTRAIHIEAVKSRKIDDFFNALSRFMSEKGIPESFISDHEASFKRASQEMEQVVKSARVQKYLKVRRISWNFYTEKSPNKGGFLERLNSNIKRTFYKTLGRRTSNFEEFRTLACHVHSTINDRPLTYIYSDIASECKALTPSMLLRGYNCNEPPHLNLRKPEDKVETKISESYKALEKIKNTFWAIWSKQYLSDLFERHVRQKKANKQLVVPKIGEVCLLMEDKIPRRDWRLGRVVDIREVRGSVREVTVQTLSPAKGLITKLKRSPDKLVPLNVASKIFSPEKLVPLEISCEVAVASSEDRKETLEVARKYTRKELAKFKKSKIWPPYKPSAQFLDPSSINVGPDQDYVNKDGSYKKIAEELPRQWK